MLWPGVQYMKNQDAGRCNVYNKSESTFTKVSLKLGRWALVCTLYTPPALWLEAVGKLTCRVACKPLLSMCSRVICQLSCSSGQSFREIAHILVHPYSFFSWSLAWPLAHYLLSLVLSFLCPYLVCSCGLFPFFLLSFLLPFSSLLLLLFVLINTFCFTLCSS